jgi:hypothetical protein
MPTAQSEWRRQTPFAAGGWLAIPSVYIAAEPGSVGRPCRDRHEACPNGVIELRKMGSNKRRGYSSNGA